MPEYKWALGNGDIVSADYNRTNDSLSNEQVLEELQSAFQQFGHSVHCEPVSDQLPEVYTISFDDPTLGRITICAKGTTPGGRSNLNDEQRTQQKSKYINYAFSVQQTGEQAAQLGIYKRDGQTIFCAWRLKSSSAEPETPISKQIKISTIAQAMKDGLVQQEKGSGEYACAFRKEFIYFYLKNMNWLHGSLVNELSEYVKPISESAEEDIFSGFKPWLTSPNNPDYTGKQKYDRYSDALRRLVDFMCNEGLLEDNDLNEKNLEKYTSWIEIYNSSNEAKDFDKKASKAGIAALKKYVKYIKFLITPCVVDFNFTTKGSSINKIFYGVPGCGKSYFIQHNILEKENYETKNIVRTTFYQDYSNTDFVGQILPKIVKGENGEKDTVEYIFNPGPFTLALIRAISNPTKKVALVIEEINRGNAPAIFGDIFQLLDRDDTSISEYGIVNVSMLDYLNAYEFVIDGEKKRYTFSEIKIPGNMDIFATMNTSDQNVYTLDTAFTRRWSKEHIPNEFNGHKIEKMYVPGMPNYTWGVFVDAINKQIRDNLETLQVNEDKQVGAFFVKEKDLLENSVDSTKQKAKMFAYKVLEYLWADVSKLDHTIIFNPTYKTFEDLVDAFATKGAIVFNDKLGFKAASLPVVEAE